MTQTHRFFVLQFPLNKMKYIVLTFLILGFLALVVVGSLQLKKDITPSPPFQLKVSATSTPTEQFIFIESAQINQPLELPIIHRVLTEERKPKGRRTKLKSPNVFVVLPSPTAVGQTINLLPLPNNNSNVPVMAKFIGSQAEQYWLRFFNSSQRSILVSQANGSGGYQWTLSTNSGPNILKESTGGGTFGDDVPDIVNLLEGIPEIKGGMEALYEMFKWFDGNTDTPNLLTNADIINDLQQVIDSYILAGAASQVQLQFQNVNEELFVDLVNQTGNNSGNQQRTYNDTNSNFTGDIHGVLNNGFTNRTNTYNLVNTVSTIGSGQFSGLTQSINAFAAISNFSNSSGQNTQPTQWWLTFAQFYAYYLYTTQLMAYFDPQYPGVETSYTSPWRSTALANAQTFSANVTSGIPQLYRLYYQFLNQFQSNIQWQQVQSYDGYGDTYCCFDNGQQGQGCGLVNNPGAQFPACSSAYYSMVNLNGPSYIPPQGNIVPSCVPNPQGAPNPVPANVVASSNGLAAYTCVTATDSAALTMIRSSFTNWLETQWNFPRKMIDTYATVMGLNCQSYTSNQLWSCTVIGSSYTENGIAFPSGNWFGIDGGSASAELSQNGVHLLCSSVTGITLNSSTFYKNFLFQIQSFTNFSVSSFDYWNPSFTTQGGCCPPDTAYIRTCWEGSVSESVGSQSNGKKGRRKFWCVTNSVNNNVTTTTDAIPVQVCEAANNATLSAGLFPFAQTNTDGANFSSFFMPSRAMQFYEGNTMDGISYWNINVDAAPSVLNNPSYGAASGYSNGSVCVPNPQSQGNANAALSPLAANLGFPTATSTAVVPQLAAYAFPCTSMTTPWVVPSFNTTQTAIVTDGSKTVTVTSQPEINAILGMPQPNVAGFFGQNLWGLQSPSATTAINPWVQGTTIFFWDQNRNILAPGTTVSATSTVTAIVMENQYPVISGSIRETSSCGLAPKALCDPCPYPSAFSQFDWTGYQDLGTTGSVFQAPSNWTLRFHY